MHQSFSSCHRTEIIFHISNKPRSIILNMTSYVSTSMLSVGCTYSFLCLKTMNLEHILALVGSFFMQEIILFLINILDWLSLKDKGLR